MSFSSLLSLAELVPRLLSRMRAHEVLCLSVVALSAFGVLGGVLMPCTTLSIEAVTKSWEKFTTLASRKCSPVISGRKIPMKQMSAGRTVQTKGRN